MKHIYIKEITKITKIKQITQNKKENVSLLLVLGIMSKLHYG
jgi:hypothetical protein